MSSSTALLPKNKKDELSITLRVCHSPWACIDQNALVTIRGFFAFYMTAFFVLLVFFKERYGAHRWTVPFEYSVIVYLLQLIYAWISFVSLTSLILIRHPLQYKRLINDTPPNSSTEELSNNNISIFRIIALAGSAHPFKPNSSI
jgi:energy-coupling factor transporter transmembrane protein EcfT